MNLVHKLYRLQNFGQQPLEYFKDMVTKEELVDAAKKQSSSKRTWYTLTQPSLINILYQVLQFQSIFPPHFHFLQIFKVFELVHL